MNRGYLHEDAIDVAHPEQLTLHLRKLKRQLVGHRLVKIEYIYHGLIERLGHILRKIECHSPVPSDEAVLLEVAAIVSCIAQEGPAFTTPLLVGESTLR